MSPERSGGAGTERSGVEEGRTKRGRCEETERGGSECGRDEWRGRATSESADAVERGAVNEERSDEPRRTERFATASSDGPTPTEAMRTDENSIDVTIINDALLAYYWAVGGGG